MWDCKECGCQGILPVLDFCPQCKATRPAVLEEIGPQAGPATDEQRLGIEHTADGTLSPEVSNDEVPVDGEAPAAPEPDGGIQAGELDDAEPEPQVTTKTRKSGNAKG